MRAPFFVPRFFAALAAACFCSCFSRTSTGSFFFVSLSSDGDTSAVHSSTVIDRAVSSFFFLLCNIKVVERKRRQYVGCGSHPVLNGHTPLDHKLSPPLSPGTRGV